MGGNAKGRSNIGRARIAPKRAMNYHTIFDLTQEGFRIWPGPALGCVLLLVGGWLIAARGRQRKPTVSFFDRVFPLVFFGFAVVWTIVMSVASYEEYRELSLALHADRLLTVEGRVTDFRPMPYTGHVLERFCVRSACFAYSDYIHTFGFHNTMSHGGPIRDGLEVRIAYVGNIIVRLEVANRGGAGMRSTTTPG
jgi:hypothetical protein